MTPALATRRKRSWTSWFLAVGTAVGVGAAVYHYHRSAERLRRRRAAPRRRRRCCRHRHLGSDLSRAVVRERRALAQTHEEGEAQAAASRAQLELLASFDGASGSFDPADAAFERGGARRDHRPPPLRG